MIFHLLATDYDGTIAENGLVADATRRALARVRESGRKVVLVTGRTLSDLERVCPAYGQQFDAVVAENGALLYHPATGEARTLGAAPEPALLRELDRRGVAYALGTCSLHTAASAAEPCLAAIRSSGVDRMAIFNKDALMLLPTGVTKGSGLGAALAALGRSFHNVAAVGDGENDHAFLALSEFAVAVADAVPALQERADYVTRAPGPRGVVEFIDEHLVRDLPDLVRQVQRHQLRLGVEAGGPITVPAHGTNLLVIGRDPEPRDKIVRVVIARLFESGRSFCLLDADGKFAALADLRKAVMVGGVGREALPAPSALEQLLAKAGGLLLNLDGLPLPEQVGHAQQALAAIHRVRRATGLPHWVVVAMGPELLARALEADGLAELGDGLCLVTTEVGRFVEALRPLITAVASPSLGLLRACTEALHWKDGTEPMADLATGEVVVAHRGQASGPVSFRLDDIRGGKAE